MQGNAKFRIWFILFVVCFTTVLPNNLSAQTKSDVDPLIAGGEINFSPVKVDGKLLFNVRGILSFPSDQRAATIALRIITAARNQQISPDSVLKIADNEVIQIYAGKEFIMNVYPIDAEAEGIDQSGLSEVIRIKTRDAIKEYRSERTRQALIKKIMYASGALVFLVALLLFLRFLNRKAGSWFRTRIQSGADSLENSSYRLIRSAQLLKAITIISKTVKIILIIAIVTGFLEYILGLFPWTNNIATTTIGLIINPLSVIGKAFISYLPSLIFLIIIILITRYLLKLIRLLFTGVESGGIVIRNFYPEWAIPTFKIVRMFVIAFAVIIAYPYIPGSGSSAFKGVSVFAGVLLSLGSSSFIGNLIAGYTMTYRRAFKKGDLIEVDNQTGFVEDQKVLVTRLRTYKNEEIVIPNSVMLSSRIINYNARLTDKGLILHTTVGIGYETPWRQVDAMLKQAAGRTDGLLKDPPPFVLKRSLGDFAINYEINVYCSDADNILENYSVLHQNILDVFNENNVQIMTPAYVYDPETPKVVPKDRWNTPVTE